MTPDFDTEFTDAIVCPWCGHEHSDSLEWFVGRSGNDTLGECWECNREFLVTQHGSVTYTTSKPKETQP